MSSLVRRFSLLLVLYLAGVIGYFSIVQASDIRSEICEASSTPSLSITSPLSDSVVTNPEQLIQGSSVRTDQITVYVNGTQTSVLLVGSSGNVTTSATLSEGTNTISLHAYYSCNQTSTITSFVVTYEPHAQPSSGSSVVTVLPSPSSSSRLPSITSETPRSSPEDEKDDLGKPVDTGTALPRMCKSIYTLSLAHIIALSLLGFVIFMTERLYKIAGRTKRRRPSNTLKLAMRGALVFLTGLVIYFLIRIISDCV